MAKYRGHPPFKDKHGPCVGLPPVHDSGPQHRTNNYRRWHSSPVAQCQTALRTTMA
jgi:hypothetical protein